MPPFATATSARHLRSQLTQVRHGTGFRAFIGVGRTGWSRSLLPPNRTGGFPASGSPVGGFTSKRIDGSESERRGENVPTQPGLPTSPTSPCIPEGIVNMSREWIVGSKPVSLATVVPARLARRHSHRCHLLRSPLSSSTFLRTLRSMAVTPLPRYYGRSDSCPPDSGALRRNVCSTCGQVSLIHAPGLPTIPSPITSKRSASPGQGTLPHQRVRPRLLPFWVLLPMGTRDFAIATQARHTSGRIEFSFLSLRRDFLRTSRSPPVASHHASRRDLALQRDRGYVRLQVTLTWRGLSPLRPSALSGARSAGLQPGTLCFQ